MAQFEDKGESQAMEALQLSRLMAGKSNMRSGLIRFFKLPLLAVTACLTPGRSVLGKVLSYSLILLAAPIMAALFLALYLCLVPLMLIFAAWSMVWSVRRRGVISEQGITFGRIYHRRTIRWSEIREVVSEQMHASVSYRIICELEEGGAQEFIMSSAPDYEAFERTLTERGIPLRIEHWHGEERLGIPG